VEEPRVVCLFAQLVQACSLRKCGFVKRRQASAAQSESLVGPIRFLAVSAALPPGVGVRRYLGMLERDVSGISPEPVVACGVELFGDAPGPEGGADIRGGAFASGADIPGGVFVSCAEIPEAAQGGNPPPWRLVRTSI